MGEGIEYKPGDAAYCQGQPCEVVGYTDTPGLVYVWFASVRRSLLVSFDDLKPRDAFMRRPIRRKYGSR